MLNAKLKAFEALRDFSDACLLVRIVISIATIGSVLAFQKDSVLILLVGMNTVAILWGISLAVHVIYHMLEPILEKKDELEQINISNLNNQKK